MVFVYTMECYSAMRKREILQSVTTWMYLEGIMLHEGSQTQKDKYCQVSHMESKYRNNNSKVVSRGSCGGGNRKTLVKCTNFHCKMNKV